MILARATIETPLGPMLALASDAGLCALEFTYRGLSPSQGTGDRPRLVRLEARLKNHFPPHDIVDGDVPVITHTRAWLKEYFDGTSADVDLPIDMHGGDFEKRVWQALLRIPAGETRSYGSIAMELSTIGASRAVGLANGANPIAIIVPCHRVIGTSGSLTGYGGGLDRKKWLLDHERRWNCSRLF